MPAHTACTGVVQCLYSATSVAIRPPPLTHTPTHTHTHTRTHNFRSTPFWRLAKNIHRLSQLGIPSGRMTKRGVGWAEYNGWKD